MNKLFLECGYMSLNKAGEQLCGDRVETIQTDDMTTLVLADGMGSGVKANILSTLTSKIIATMAANDMPIEECVETIAQTLPVCKTRMVAYSTFTILRADNDRNVFITQFDNPSVIILREGKSLDYTKEEKVISGKKIYESCFRAEIGDMFILMSDGVPHAGVGVLLNFGWQMENIITFAEQAWKSDMSAKSMAVTIANECRELYMNEPGDDTTVAAMKIREREVVNLMIGPPVKPEDDENVLGEFFGSEGKHIVCGGTTSAMVARYLKEEVTTQLDYFDPKIPPIGHIKGVDLVTEGVITMGRVVELVQQYTSNTEAQCLWHHKKDGASLIAKLLVEDATDVQFYVGRAINPAHQNPELPLNLSLKLRLIEDVCKCLEKLGKRVTLNYY